MKMNEVMKPTLEENKNEHKNDYELSPLTS